MKVRLIRPLLVEIARLDTQATAYDNDFREPSLGGAPPTGEPDRDESDTVQIKAQVEFEGLGRQVQTFTGNMPDSQLVLVLDFDDLAKRGLIDAASNETSLRVNDRVVSIRNGKGILIQSFPNPPGLFITELRSSYGMERDRNIILAFCNDREKALARGF